MIDLRSDTVTRPDEGMRRAMYEAEVGDDVFGEDPTVLRLQDTVADLLDKEAALFVPSGVMGNQLALRSHASPGDEVIVDRTSHILNYESGAASALSGIQLSPIDGPGGVMLPGQVARAIRHGYYWETPTRLICLENTLNKAGGRVFPEDATTAIARVSAERGLMMHLDGARLWNASIATGTPMSKLAAPFDSVSVCLSKGLGAPVGSVVAGSTEFISRAHRYRKLYGGGMRQVGILAAAGLYAIRHNFDRLADDHANAQTLAAGLAAIPGIAIDPVSVESNIVMFDVAEGTAMACVEELKTVGVLVVPFGPSTIRATTHKDVSSAEVLDAVTRVREKLQISA